ncbi:MAG TPA: hypothetical protein VLZ07_09505 [Syntrophales bacterium]|nr:hypothetical protein [Syntrophales bacterium]
MIDPEAKNCFHNKHVPWRKERKTRLPGFTVRAILPICLLILLCGCAPALYHVDLKYEPSGTSIQPEKELQDFLVTVATFNDVRKVDDSLYMGKVKTLEGGTVPIAPRRNKVPQEVTATIRDYLLKAGYKLTKDIYSWDLREETIKRDWGRILVGGNIDDLEIVCEESFPVKTYKAKVRLTFVLADVPEKKVFYRASVESSNSLKDVSFSPELLAKEINGVLSDAMERMFNDPKMRKTIEEKAKTTQTH